MNYFNVATVYPYNSINKAAATTRTYAVIANSSSIIRIQLLSEFVCFISHSNLAGYDCIRIQRNALTKR